MGREERDIAGGYRQGGEGMRQFETGATRDDSESKFDFEGFLSPACLEAYGEYMHKHRVQADGALRDSDNWQKGMDKSVYIKSMFRHAMDLWFIHRGILRDDKKDGHRLTAKEVCCALLFNVFGYLFEDIKLLPQPLDHRGGPQ